VEEEEGEEEEVEEEEEGEEEEGEEEEGEEEEGEEEEVVVEEEEVEMGQRWMPTWATMQACHRRRGSCEGLQALPPTGDASRGAAGAGCRG
jgi:hypothetical protein